jgi:IS4 transposase
VDGSLLPALPKLAEAMWLNEQHRAFKMHTHFELLKSVPVRMDLTDGNSNEREVLESCLQPGRTYVMDRGYAKFQLFAEILQAESSFVCRVRDNSVVEEVESRPLSDVAVRAGIVRDRAVRFPGAAKVLDRPLRLVEVRCTPHRRAGGHTGRGGPEQGETLLIASDLLDVPVEVIALIYKHRWAIETFFRFFKHVLGCRHLLSHCTNGIEIQVYLGIIACLLIGLWTGRKPTLRTYEMICFYFTGLASEEELLAHIKNLALQS